MRNVSYPMINAVDTTTQTGAPLFVGQVISASFTTVCADVTAAGTVKIQGSNEPSTTGDPTKYIPSNASFSDIPNATASVASGVAPAIMINVLTYQYIRAVFTYSSGGSSTILVRASTCNVT